MSSPSSVSLDGQHHSDRVTYGMRDTNNPDRNQLSTRRRTAHPSTCLHKTWPGFLHVHTRHTCSCLLLIPSAFRLNPSCPTYSPVIDFFGNFAACTYTPGETLNSSKIITSYKHEQTLVVPQLQTPHHHSLAFETPLPVRRCPRLGPIFLFFYETPIIVDRYQTRARFFKWIFLCILMVTLRGGLYAHSIAFSLIFI